MQPRRSQKSVVAAIVIVLCGWAILGIVLFGRHAVFDWWRLYNYTAPDAVQQLATDTTMNESARRLFYAYHPSVEAGANFNTHCRDSEYTIVLGCYVAYQGIYIFDINDERLRGVQQVTAAHEMLHAAYDRLSKKDRARVDRLTAEAYATLQDQRIKNNIQQYKDNDPSVVPNELHSIIGTEVKNVPPELEQYYKRYFTDRAKIVMYSEHYESAFTSVTSQLENLKGDLTKLKNEIDEANTELRSEQTYLASVGPGLKDRAQRGEASDQEITDYNDRVNAYNAKISDTNRLITTYNNKRDQYNQLVGEQSDLFKKIDSRQSITAQ